MCANQISTFPFTLLEASKKEVNRSLLGAISERSAGLFVFILLCDGELGLKRAREMGKLVLCR